VPTSLVIVGQLGGVWSAGAEDHHAFAGPLQCPGGDTWPSRTPVPPARPRCRGRACQSFPHGSAAGAMKPLTWSGLRPGHYLFESARHPSIQGPMGLYGYWWYHRAVGRPSWPCLPRRTYNADVPLLFSEMTGSEHGRHHRGRRWGSPRPRCGPGQPTNAAIPLRPIITRAIARGELHPVYYMINGVAFHKTKLPASLFPIRGRYPWHRLVLVRRSNAGLRMHVPRSRIADRTTGGAGMSLIAEDG